MGDEKRDIKIGDWMRIFEDIYGESDSHRSPEQIWIAVMAHCSSIGESIRRTNYQELLHYAAHAFCWLCSYVNKCNHLEDNIFSYTGCLSSMVSLKYPLICGFCKQSTCRCSPEEMDKVRDKVARYEELFEERKKVNFTTFTISQWQGTFDKIYGGRVHISTLETLGFHFLEEVGEAALALRKLSQLKRILSGQIEGIDSAFLRELSTVEGITQNFVSYYKKPDEIDYTSEQPGELKARMVDAKMGMVIEIADTFSWFCSILNKLSSISEENDVHLSSLDEELDKEYFDENKESICPTCEHRVCSCAFFS